MLAAFANDFITHCEHIVCIILCVCIHKHCTCCDHVIPLQYPEWIDEHKDELSSSEISRYKSQLDVMRRICDHYESPTPSNNDEKVANQKRILELMQQVNIIG